MVEFQLITNGGCQSRGSESASADSEKNSAARFASSDEAPAGNVGGAAVMVEGTQPSSKLALSQQHVHRQFAPTGTAETVIKYCSLALLTVQCAIIPLLIHYNDVRPKAQAHASTANVFVMECMKLAGAVAILMFQKRSVAVVCSTITSALLDHPKQTFLVCIPSLIYAVQNNLLFVGLANLDPATFTVTYQLKILTTALFSVSILRRPLSVPQWLAVVILTAGVALVQLAQKMDQGGTTAGTASSVTVFENTTEEHVPNPLVGLLAVLVMCLTSGFASIYFEKILKGSTDSVWIQNVRLATFGIPMNLLILMYQDGIRINQEGLLVGFDWVIWATIGLMAFAGLTIAVVIKFADNILKSYAQGISILIGCLGSMYFFEFHPNRLFLVGALLVGASTVIYAKYPVRAPSWNADGRTSPASLVDDADEDRYRKVEKLKAKKSDVSVLIED